MRRILSSFVALAFALATGCGQAPSGTGKTGTTRQQGTQNVNWDVYVSKPVGGTVTSAPAGLSCSPTNTGVVCDFLFDWAVESVTLTATPDAGKTFSQWGGDCSGTSTTCVLSRASGAFDKTVVAVFAGPGIDPPAPVPTNADGSVTQGRVYGYLKDGAAGVGSVTVSLVDPVSGATTATATTSAAGAYAFEVAPGTYNLSTAATAKYLATAPASVTLPATAIIQNGAIVANPACIKGFYVPTAPNTQPGCLLHVGDVALALNPGYVANPVTVAVTASKSYLAGFGQDIALTCTPSGGGAFVKWEQTAGPTDVKATALAWGQTPTFTTPTLSALFSLVPDPVKCPNGAGTASTTNKGANNKVGCGVGNFGSDNRSGAIAINKQQAGELTYTFQCTVSDGTNSATKTVNVQLASFTMANIANGNREAVYPVTGPCGTTAGVPCTYAAAGLPEVSGPLWASGAEFVTSTSDGGTFRAHDTVTVPTGTIVIMDEGTGYDPSTGTTQTAPYDWKACSGNTPGGKGAALSKYTDCTAWTGVLNDKDSANPWFVAPGATIYLVNKYMPKMVTKGGFYGPPNIPVKGSAWGGLKGVALDGSLEACGNCHVFPGTNPVFDPISGTTTYELGPQTGLEWKASKHARIVIDAGSGTHYSSSCLPCHSAGYDPAVSNGGWDDVAAAQVPAYKLPDFTFEGATAGIFTDAMPLAVKRLTNVQCENCHGPATSTGHTASLSAKVCGFCHDGGHHGLYTQWKKSGHSNLAMAQDEGPKHGRDQTHCGRCHFGQGYVEYAKQLKSGNADKLGNVGIAGSEQGPIFCSPYTTSSADTCPTGQSVGLITTDNVEPQTCQACHDPHSLEVRVKGSDTGGAGLLLAGGFRIQNAGAGALCASCHNSRNGIVGAVAPNRNTSVTGSAGWALTHTDANPLTNVTSGASANFGMTGPHGAAQADVYFAGNGYLLCNNNADTGACTMPSTPNQHREANFFADTCAECHVKRHTEETEGWGTVVNHTFEIDAHTCAGCHGAGGELEYRETLVASKLVQYKASLKTVLNGAGITSVTGKLNGAPAAAYTPSSAITAVNVTGDRPLTLDLTFANGDVLAGCNIDTFSSGATPTLYALSGTTKLYGKVAKSMYDYALINNDGSSGVHNMPFVDAMLGAMINNLDSPGLPK